MARSSPRRGRRWQNPSSPLQAARFARRWTGQQVCDRIRTVCPGHGGGVCKLDVAKLSDFERGARRPSVLHIQALCEVLQASAEDLGLITWRRHPEPDVAPDGTGARSAVPRECCGCGHGLDPERLVLDWVRTNAATVLAEAFRTLIQQRSQARPDRPPRDLG